MWFRRAHARRSVGQISCEGTRKPQRDEPVTVIPLLYNLRRELIVYRSSCDLEDSTLFQEKEKGKTKSTEYRPLLFDSCSRSLVFKTNSTGQRRQQRTNLSLQLQEQSSKLFGTSSSLSVVTTGEYSELHETYESSTRLNKPTNEFQN